MDKPTGTLLRCLALLARVTESKVVRFFDEKDKDVAKALHDAFKREQWKEHRLYRERKETLMSMCKEKGIETSGTKYEIVERLALAMNEPSPKEPELFTGDKVLPKSTKDIAKMSIAHLQSVIKFHGLVPCGSKDELVLRVSLITNNRKHLCFNREWQRFQELVSVTREFILEERKQAILAEDSPIYRQRPFSTPVEPTLSSDRPRYHAGVQTEYSVKSRLDIPLNVNQANVHDVFEELAHDLNVKRNDHTRGECAAKEEHEAEECMKESETMDKRAARILQKGARVCGKF